MRRVRRIICGVLSIAFFHVQCNSPEKMATVKLSEPQLTVLAVKEAVRLGFKQGDFEVVLDSDNERWMKIWRTVSTANPTLAGPPKGRSFTALYIRPKREQLGGDLWVLVDNFTGEVLFRLPGK